MSYPRVSIIVLVYNNYSDTKECLNSLGEITYSNCEVIVVDNSSADGSVERLEKEYRCHTFIFNKENLGFAGGVNVGIQHAIKEGADYILLLGNDVVVDKGFLEPLISTAEKDRTTGIVGSKIYYYSKPQIINFAGARINFWNGSTPHIGTGELDRGQYEESRQEDYQDGCAFLIRRDVIDKIGLFDTAYFLYYEEVDFCCRTRKAGYKILNVPQSRVWHKISASVGGSESLVAIYHSNRSKMIFMKKYARFYHWVIFSICSIYYSGKKILKWLILHGLSREFAKRVKILANSIKDGICSKLSHRYIK